jgi:hypothetical protein
MICRDSIPVLKTETKKILGRRVALIGGTLEILRRFAAVRRESIAMITTEPVIELSLHVVAIRRQLEIPGGASSIGEHVLTVIETLGVGVLCIGVSLVGCPPEAEQCIDAINGDTFVVLQIDCIMVLGGCIILVGGEFEIFCGLEAPS